MANIPDTEYVTIKRGRGGMVDVFVGGKPATHYRGVNINDINYVKNAFAWIQEYYPNITEWHVLSSKTSGGEFATVGNPSPERGRYAWCRVKNNDGKLGGWVFDHAYTSASDCECFCAYFCAYDVRAFAAFQRAVLGTALDKQNVEPVTQPEKKSQNPEIEKLKVVDFSKLPKSPIELNGYRILVEKISTRTK